MQRKQWRERECSRPCCYSDMGTKQILCPGRSRRTETLWLPWGWLFKRGCREGWGEGFKDCGVKKGISLRMSTLSFCLLWNLWRELKIGEEATVTQWSDVWTSPQPSHLLIHPPLNSFLIRPLFSGLFVLKLTHTIVQVDLELLNAGITGLWPHPAS